MGNGLAPPPVDYRIERTMKNFQLPMNKVEELWKIFCRHDREGTGYLAVDEFFERIIRYPRSGLTDQMFRLIESKNDTALTFGEFVEMVTTFACFERKELLRYFFYILDSHRSGLIEKTELKHFIFGMWNHDISSNVQDGINYLESIDEGDGAFNFLQIESVQLKYPIVFSPLYKLQVHIIMYTLGETWWEAHKANLMDERAEREAKEMAKLVAKEKAEEKEKALVSDEMIRKRMGFLKYYLMPWEREKAKNRILKIAAIESELDQALKKMR
mmetsp:Transcript_25800/g.43047  ORF Transcript_25800/g.43047 Transcript_25800/m.43047 type:complete len:272 (-) Transcript_25800:1343-2158(-)|eukprot:CAMPEP_0175014860 /NCGR_PEP_ID=MMETSP0005-20121125/10831_1 /TAXON_ID=420556 /ORGANISM="Ochromonas sp., Strain CCMP1393" /LENGTH=271 /DNA_ID=CAMNT_0016271719 /DNA_START=45 /DNA_END=860 /DNA_ORIENTATION=+